MGIRADEAAAETPSYYSVPITVLSTDSEEEDHQWKVLKSSIPGYQNPQEKAEKKKKENQRKAQVMSSASFRTPSTASTEPQRCHSCGWIGVPKILQVCPACSGRDILSDAFTELNLGRTNAPERNGGFDTHQTDGIDLDGDFDSHQARGTTDDHDDGGFDSHQARSTINEHVMPLEYEDEDDDEMVMDLEEEVEVYVASDTGSVAHVVGPKDLPGSIRVRAPPSGKVRNFVGAGGDGIKCHGEATVELLQENGNVVSTDFQVADVVRPLHSVSKICDGTGEKHHEMLYTRECGYVVPEGTLSRFLAQVNVITRYPRRGGLYVAKMKARRPRPRPSPAAGKPSFTRPGRKS